MEPIELNNCFVGFDGNTVSILFKSAPTNSRAASRGVMEYLIDEGFIRSGNYMIKIGMPI